MSSLDDQITAFFSAFGAKLGAVSMRLDRIAEARAAADQADPRCPPEIAAQIDESGGYPFAQQREEFHAPLGASGMCRETGRWIFGDAHLRQSLTDLFTTPKGTRIGRRGYGIPMEMIAAPLNQENMIELCAAMAAAIRRWEPRLKLIRIQIEEASADGRAVVALTTQPVNNPSPGVDTVPEILRIPLSHPRECRA